MPAWSLAVGYSKNGLLHLLSHPTAASLSWWPWASPPPAPCTMGFPCHFVPCVHTNMHPFQLPCSNAGWVPLLGPRVQKHGVAVFGQARVAPVTYRGTHTRTQEDLEMQQHQHLDTHIDPSRGLYNAENHILYWIGTVKNDGSKTKTPKSARTRGRPGGGATPRVLGRQLPLPPPPPPRGLRPTVSCQRCCPQASMGAKGA